MTYKLWVTASRLASLAAETYARQSESRLPLRFVSAESPKHYMTVSSPLVTRMSTSMVNGKLADADALRGKRTRVKSLLDEGAERVWRDQLRHLSLLLQESGADGLGAIVYTVDDQLFCEVGPAGSSLLLCLDNEGSILTFRDSEQAKGEGGYRCVSWDTLPSLDQFADELHRYRQARTVEKGGSMYRSGALKWGRPTQCFPTTSLSDVDFEMVPAPHTSFPMMTASAF